jgi:putative sugar O-methyltransferase
MKNNYPLLNEATALMQQQKTFYQPTSFWAQASEKIREEFCALGIENFRSHPTALSYFVPNYGIPASGLNEQQVELLRSTLQKNFPDSKKSHLSLDHSLSGKQSALADYRVFRASEQQDALPTLINFTESQVGNPIEQWTWEGKNYSRSAMNYLLGLSFLKKYLHGDIPRTLLEIGGGFGTLGEIWSQSGIDQWKYIDIDIPPTQFAADYYLKQILGADQVTGFDDLLDQKSIPIDFLKPASVLCSWQIEHLQGEVDLFVNFISFQEMEPDVVRNYLYHIDRLKTRWVLLRNMREGKQIKRDGHVGVMTPIRSDDYIDMLPGYQLVARNVLPYGFETVDGFHSELQLLKRKS